MWGSREPREGLAWGLCGVCGCGAYSFKNFIVKHCFHIVLTARPHCSFEFTFRCFICVCATRVTKGPRRLRVAKPSGIDLAAHLTKRVFVVPLQLLTEERRFATCLTGMPILDPCGCVLAELPSAKVITDGVKLVVELNNDTLKAVASLAEGGECGPGFTAFFASPPHV